MSPRIYRSPLAFMLAAVMLFSLFPPLFEAEGHTLAAQTGSSTRSRRGKNGPSSSGGKSSTRTSQPARSSDAPARQDSKDQDDKDQDDVVTPTQGAPAPVDQGAAASTPNKRTPPPFDRPPLSAGDAQSQPQATQDSRPDDSRSRNQQQPARPPYNQPPADNRQASDPPKTGDTDWPGADRSGRNAPVLRRPSDSRQQGDRPGETAPPRSGGGNREPEYNQEPPAGGDEAIKLDATLVNIPLLVSDRSGRFIPQLSQKDFILYEDGVQQEIAFFGSEQVPFNVALLLDMSPSVAGYLEEIQNAAIAFVRQLRHNDRVMVVSFDRSVDFLTDFTSDRRVLERAILSTTTGSGTSVYDAVLLAVERKLRNIEGRKALILFSDGEDTTSRYADYDNAIDVVTESDVLVYGLRYPSDGGNIRINPWPRNRVPQIPFPFPWPWPRRRRGGTLIDISTIRQPAAIAMSNAANVQWSRRGRGDFMEDVATAGGGPVYNAEQVSDIGRLASRIAEELRHVYVVSYYPTNPLSNGGFRTIRVRVKGRDDIAVRHRRGYNAREASSQPRT